MNLKSKVKTIGIKMNQNKKAQIIDRKMSGASLNNPTIKKANIINIAIP
jgi:hypothetical protein